VESISLVAGSDYPNTYRGFVKMFPDNAACAAYRTWFDTWIWMGI